MKTARQAPRLIGRLSLEGRIFMKKTSFRSQIIRIFVATMAAMIILIVAINHFFLGNFYTREKRRILKETYNKLNELVNADEEEFSSEVLEMSVSDNIQVLVTDSDFQIMRSTSREEEELAYCLFGYFTGFYRGTLTVLEQTDTYTIQLSSQEKPSMRPGAEKEEGMGEEEERTKEEGLAGLEGLFGRKSASSAEDGSSSDHRYIFGGSLRSGTEYLEMWGQLKDGSWFLIRTPMESIEHAAQLSNRFYLYVGLAVMIVAIVCIYVLAGRFTRPVVQLTDLSKRMAGLDFEARYTGHTGNEVDELGQNFNTMSDQLEKTISELKSANVELQKDVERRTQIDEMRKDFLNNVSHELKTPIALIQGYAEGLKDGIADDPDSRDYYLDVIIDESGKMNKMVRQLLSLNALEFGKDQVTMDRFDLTSLIRGVLAGMKLMIDEKGAEVSFHCEEPVYVWGDEFKIEEVVTNYLSNALNHLDYERKIEIRIMEEDGIVTTSVFNTGDPIPEEDLDKVWDKFYKVDKARTRAYGGSGIGLSIVKAVMDGHHQRCWARNFDNGVAFYFTLEGKAE